MGPERDRSSRPGGRTPRRVQLVVAGGLAIVLSAAALIGIGAISGPAATSDAPAAEAAGPASTAPTVTVSKVTATSTVATTGTTVRTVLTVANSDAARKPAVHAWLYLASGTRRYALGQVTVPALAAGATTIVRALHGAPPRAAAGTYSVLACSGVYSAAKCRTSAATVTTGAASRARPETGVMLDVARAYYPVPLIEQYIDLLADHGGRFLHLHLTDDQNVGIESAVLGQTLADADLDHGVWTSRVTGRPFLSAAQARQIARHAAERGIAIVPEVDTPGHMAAAFALLEAKHGTAWVDRIRAHGTDGESELDPSAPGSLALATDLAAEVTRTFPSSRTVHIGGDEWGADVTADARVAWLNAMAAGLGDRAVWAWNDGIDRAAIKRLDPRIQVTYWSFDGDTEDVAERVERRQRRASASDLDAAGFAMLNYNSYYLYEVPTDLDPADSEYTVADLRQHWSLRTWDGDSGARLPSPMAGAAVAIWGEDLERPPSGDLLRWSAPHVVAMIDTAAS